jgi:hypothetical protein
MALLVDAGALYAQADRADPRHRAVVEILRTERGRNTDVSGEPALPTAGQRSGLRHIPLADRPDRVGGQVDDRDRLASQRDELDHVSRWDTIPTGKHLHDDPDVTCSQILLGQVTQEDHFIELLDHWRPPDVGGYAVTSRGTC